MDTDLKITLWFVLGVIFTVSILSTWSAHDARVRTNERFKMAVEHGYSCSGGLEHACIKLEPLLVNAEKE